MPQVERLDPLRGLNKRHQHPQILSHNVSECHATVPARPQQDTPTPHGLSHTHTIAENQGYTLRCLPPPAPVPVVNNAPQPLLALLLKEERGEGVMLPDPATTVPSRKTFAAFHRLRVRAVRCVVWVLFLLCWWCVVRRRRPIRLPLLFNLLSMLMRHRTPQTPQHRPRPAPARHHRREVDPQGAAAKPRLPILPGARYIGGSAGEGGGRGRGAGPAASLPMRSGR